MLSASEAAAQADTAKVIDVVADRRRAKALKVRNCKCILTFHGVIPYVVDVAAGSEDGGAGSRAGGLGRRCKQPPEVPKVVVLRLMRFGMSCCWYAGLHGRH